MTDRELLELAAKAMGFQNYTMKSNDVYVETGLNRGDSGYYWNPLANDGDALRLAVKLRLEPRFLSDSVQVIFCADSDIGNWEDCLAEEKTDNDPYAATRRAIVRAAAELGKE